MKNKHIYMWYDGDVKRHYFSSKVNFNKWLNEFIGEIIRDPCNDNLIKNKSKQDLKKHFSGPLYLEKICLDEVIS